MSKVETMLHPFTGIVCDVQHLQPGENIMTGDVYRSVTMIEAKSALGTWFVATDVLDGWPIGPACNVHFLRLTPTLGVENVIKAPGKKASELTIQHHGQGR